ncbi:transmembrane emp24 domain-containing protein 1-like [Lycorma delicatula]|uniref:transmembrane emp24 domain-containing protein 1-like n=1 Tax=Lycorma delicatula TaxID=130591 RepID=UPI003F51A3DC
MISKYKHNFILFIAALYFFVYSSVGLEVELTIYIDPGREECFYQPLKASQELEIDYQVVSGGQGELDINFHFYDPDGVVLFTDSKHGENSHRHVITEDGDYKLCWDNYFSSFNPKTVFFSIYIDGEKEWLDNYSVFEAEEEYEGMVNAIKEVLLKVHSDITKVRQIQEVFRANEARDRNLAERNYTRVNSWSATQIFAMLFVGLIQVAMIRGLLDSQSKFHQIWKYMCIPR